jgi:hypothetical protein
MGRLSTIHLLAQTSLDQLRLILKTFFTFYKTSYLNEEVNRTEPSPSVSIPWFVNMTPVGTNVTTNLICYL